MYRDLNASLSRLVLSTLTRCLPTLVHRCLYGLYQPRSHLAHLSHPLQTSASNCSPGHPDVSALLDSRVASPVPPEHRSHHRNGSRIHLDHLTPSKPSMSSSVGERDSLSIPSLLPKALSASHHHQRKGRSLGRYYVALEGNGATIQEPG